jgi:ABC-type sulfate/molybdate transport systems ATPase subunit
VLLLDEPLANLDPVVAELVGGLLGPAPGRTRVIASHDPARALEEADLVVVLGAGAAVRHVGPAEGLTVADVEAMYR